MQPHTVPPRPPARPAAPQQPAAILARVLTHVANGIEIQHAYDAVFGTGAYEKLTAELYGDLRARSAADAERAHIAQVAKGMLVNVDKWSGSDPSATEAHPEPPHFCETDPQAAGQRTHPETGLLRFELRLSCYPSVEARQYDGDRETRPVAPGLGET
ncbi:hypothetical protein HDG34_005840 [Paraburkholderia sp. HC6.4b]|uniref:hypothetical protein n=1 Tax=unclassified Paraburkholderia TaxID=2615204 RepID=UPI00161E12AC|nr:MULTISPECIES: hypothetical protein [unclassified Paraburkholderia]MBB5411874.1 hypothetical protein [Paraburkholderia sp. HC6.4b]MBB5450186.1 hypothetical protein [Paraburkholderia sp. Kb1A]